MTSFDNYQNALRQAIVLNIMPFVKNRSCVTQVCITKIAAKCILVVVVKWRHHANVLLPYNFISNYFSAQLSTHLQPVPFSWFINTLKRNKERPEAIFTTRQTCFVQYLKTNPNLRVFKYFTFTARQSRTTIAKVDTRCNSSHCTQCCIVLSGPLAKIDQSKLFKK